MRSTLFLACLVAAAQSAGLAQDTLSLSNVSTWQPTWRFAQGGDSTWSRPDFDDSAWETRSTTVFDPGIVDSAGWSGNGWFRTRFVTDSSIAGAPIMYVLSLAGAGELYLDGALLDRFGRPPTAIHPEEAVRFTKEDPAFGLVPLLTPGVHHFAFHVSNVFLSKEGETEYGFRMHLGKAPRVTAALAHSSRVYAAETFLLTGIAGVLALIYLLLFAFQPKQVKNVLFGLLSGLAAVVIFADMHSRLVNDAASYVWWRRYMEIAGAAGWIVAVRLIGISFFKEAWKLFNVLLIVAALVILYLYFDPIGGFWSLIVLSVLATVELGRRVGLAVFLSRPAAWLVAAGLILLVLGGLHEYVTHHGWMEPILGMGNLFHFGIVGFLTLMGLYLGTEFARANRALEMKVVQVRQEAEKALQEEKVNQDLRIGRIQTEFDNRRKDLEQQKAREMDAIRKSLTVNEEHLKAVKKRLVATEETASLGRLAVGIAHDVHDLLKGIDELTALSEDLAAELEHAEAGGRGKPSEILPHLQKNLERIREQGALADAVVNDILLHASEAGQSAEQVDVNQLVDRYLNLALHASRGDFPDLDLVVERVLDERVGAVVAPPAAFGRALMGIFRNAVEALAEHAEKADDDFDPTITVSTQRLENAILIRVRDNGPGVPQDLRDRIFEPFYSTSPDKSGLGLAIANRIIVDELEGTFGLEHFKEQGAGFYITLPLAKSDSAGASGPVSE